MIDDELKKAAEFFKKDLFSAVELTEDEIRRAAGALADAFSQYHMIDWLHRCKGNEVKLKAFFEMELSANRTGSVFLANSSDFNSFALLKPDCSDPGSFMLYLKAAGKVISRSGLRSLIRMIRYSGKMTKFRLNLVGKVPWYLYYIGTEQSGQGKGYGSMLLKRIAAYMDIIESDIYIETNDYENVVFYSRFGFEEIGRFDYADFKCYCLLRKPATETTQITE